MLSTFKEREPTTYYCNSCDKVFNQRHNFRDHMMRKHGIEVPMKFTRDKEESNKKRKPELLEIDCDVDEIKVDPYSR